MVATVLPIRQRHHDAELDCDVQEIVGYAARCPRCSWRGPYRVSFAVARADAHAHNREHRT